MNYELIAETYDVEDGGERMGTAWIVDSTKAQVLQVELTELDITAAGLPIATTDEDLVDVLILAASRAVGTQWHFASDTVKWGRHGNARGMALSASVAVTQAGTE